METDSKNNQFMGLEETPGQKALAISDALEFLRGEAVAKGLTDVADFIDKARTKAKSYAPPP